MCFSNKVPGDGEADAAHGPLRGPLNLKLPRESEDTPRELNPAPAKGFTISGCGPASISVKVLVEGDPESSRVSLSCPALTSEGSPRRRGVAYPHG